MRFKRIFASLASCLLLLNCNSLSVTAEVTLPPGAVKGLPERLAALDNEGNAVNSATGEYFFHVEDMEYGVTYSKEVQLMNLRDDAAYYIYFYVEPLFKNGEIDLEKGCECTFYLDGVQFYKGDVNGKGNIDLSEEYKNCGYFNPGDSHILRAEVIWNDLDVIQNVDNGHRLVDKHGEHVLVGPDESGYAEGEIEFKWIFFASIYDWGDATEDTNTTTDPQDATTYNTTDSPPSTGDVASDTQDPTEPTGDATGITSETSEPPSTVEANTTVNTTNPGENTDYLTTSSVTTVTTTPTTNPSGDFFSPFTGYRGKDGTIWLIGMAVFGGMIVVMLILIRRKKKGQKK